MDELNLPSSSEIDFEQIFDFSPNLICVLDREHNIIRGNQAMAKFTGISTDELVGLKCYQCVHQTDEPPSFCELSKILEDGQELTDEMFLENLDKWFSVSATPLRNKVGTITGAIHIARDITDRKRIEESLREKEAYFYSLFEHAPMGYQSLDEDGCFIEVNQAWLETLGYTREEVIGKWFGEFMTPEFVDGFRERFPLFKAKGKIHSEFEMLHKDGRRLVIAFEGRIGYKPDGTFKQTHCILSDITKRKKVEKELRESAAYLDIMGDALMVLDSQSNVVKVNNLFSKLWGYTFNEVYGKPVFGMFPKEELSKHQSEMEKTSKKGGVRTFDTIALTKAKKLINVSVSGTILKDKNGKLLNFIALFRDITDRIQAEEEIKRKNEELQLLNTEKDKFFSIISHDLRTPFNNFLGFTQLLVEKLPTFTLKEIHKIAVSMRTTATDLFSLLENLLEWSRLQRDVVIFSPSSFMLMQKISESMSLVVESATKKEIDISYAIPDELTVFADENMLRSIICNLSANAIKFTPHAGKITITAKSLDNDWIEISVKDTGIGMNKEMVGNLFQVGINTSRTGTAGEPGTGLGLIICKEFIEKHGGKIWVESQKGKGSTFYFKLPAKISD